MTSRRSGRPRSPGHKLARLGGAVVLPVVLPAPEFIADLLLEWLGEQQVWGVFIAKASPQQNCYIERFNGSMEREVFKHELFHSVLETQVVVDEWLLLYNTRRAHRGLGGKAPAAYAKMAKSQMNEDRQGGVTESAYHH